MLFNACFITEPSFSSIFQMGEIITWELGTEFAVKT